MFDTYQAPDDFDEFIKVGITEGHIVVAACMDDCTTRLSEAGK